METRKEERELCRADAKRWEESIFGRDIVPLTARDKDFGAAMAFSDRLCRDVDTLEEEIRALEEEIELCPATSHHTRAP